MSDTESPDSPQVKFVREWSQGFDKKDLDIIAKSLHKDFRVVVYPRSLNQPDRTKEEWLGFLAGVISLWTDTERTTNSITETPGKVVVHVRIPNVKIEAAAAYYLISQWTNKTKTSIGVDTTYEAISIAHVVTDEDGSLKIKQIEQFVDSKAYLDSLQAFAAAKAKK